MNINFIKLKKLNICEQLALEENLLKSSNENFCIINEGSNKSIVLGISGKEEELINFQKPGIEQIKIIRRFTGGGTVIVDENTIFITFILQNDTNFYPERIYKWTENFYKQAFKEKSFSLKEFDYVFSNKKCGGSAQYIKRNRWLHHTTFLWDFEEENMDYLLLPKKTPKYREKRSHKEFLCKLKDFFPSKNYITEKIKTLLRTEYSLKFC